MLAHASEGQQSAIERAKAYVEAGADAIFAEAVHTLKDPEVLQCTGHRSFRFSGQPWTIASMPNI